MVRTLRTELGSEHGTVKQVAEQLGYGVESVRLSVRQADIDDGHQPGTTTTEAARVRELEQGELRQANDLEAGREFLRGGARPPVAQVVVFIGAHREAVVEGRPLGVEPICRVPQVAPSTYYAAKTRRPSRKACRDGLLVAQLVALWEDNYRVYGPASSG